MKAALASDGAAFDARLAKPSASLRWALPFLLGLGVAAALMSDAFWGRGFSLRTAAPWLRGLAPPVFSLCAALLVLIGLGFVLLGKKLHPPKDCWLIALLFCATQLVGFSLANIEPLKISLLIVCICWLAEALSHNKTVRLYPPLLMLWLVILAFAFASIVNGLVTSLVAQYTIAAKFLMFFIVANLIRRCKKRFSTSGICPFRWKTTHRNTGSKKHLWVG